MKRKRLFLLGFTILLFVAGAGCEIQTLTVATTTTLQPEDQLDYSDFPELFISDVSMQLSMPEDDYYLYFYMNGCQSCSEIKQTILHKIQSLTEDKIYLVLVKFESDIHEDIGVAAVPLIVYVVDHEVISFYKGKTDVLGALAELK